MFQYAFAKYLECKYDTKVALDVSWFSQTTERRFDVDIIDNQIALRGNFWRKLAEKSGYNPTIVKICHFVNAERLYRKLHSKQIVNEWDLDKTTLYKDKPYTFFRFFQTPVYAEYLRKHNKSFFENIKPQGDVPQELKAVYEEILSTENAICMHVRKGDYTKPEWRLLNVCNNEYYERGLQHILEKHPNSKIFVFSNDFKWVEDNLPLPSNKVFVPISDCNQFWYVWMMSKCKHFVISNSTFSWWGAYLCSYPQKIVVCPDHWIRPEYYERGTLIYANGMNEVEGWTKIATGL